MCYKKKIELLYFFLVGVGHHQSEETTHREKGSCIGRFSVLSNKIHTITQRILIFRT